jgi:hypothetical protein
VRVSEYFKLRVGQDALDFVDVDVEKDDPVFIDPRALRTLRTPWTDECVTLLQDFFSTVLTLIRAGKHVRARTLLRQLREPNETHLGLSRGRSRGRALGPQSSRDVWDALLNSEAIRTGLLEDLEETVLMIEGISFDIVSDIATNVMRQPLIRFTQAECVKHSIPTSSIGSGPMWDPRHHDWFQQYEQLPLAAGAKLLLVPKIIVRKKLDYRADEYFQHYVLDFLMQQELASNSELVYLLKDGTPRVGKKALIAKYGRGKHVASRITREHPEILDRYRVAKRSRKSRSLDHEELAEELPGVATPDWSDLLHAVTSVDPGRAGADAYHRAIEAALTALFYPDLVWPEREVRIHDGRKRIDLTFANQAQSGFFHWIAQHHPAMYIIVECKNYVGDPGNPELDQIAGRFSPSRGKIGLLMCRAFNDKTLFIERCRDTANDQRGFVMPFDDDDLGALMRDRRNGDALALNALLKQRFETLVL